MAKLRTLLITAAALLLTNSSVLAANANLGAFDTNGRALVTGTADGGNKYVSAAVFADDKAHSRSTLVNAFEVAGKR